MSFLAIIKERRQRAEARRQDAVSEVKRLAALLRERFSFDELYLIGSAVSDKFRLHSDIDLVIKGLRIEDFFKAHALLLKESEFDIDLKPFEDLPDDFKKRVMSGGLKVG